MNISQVDPIGLGLLLGSLSLLPLLLICTTCFLKVSVALMIVKNAIGVQQVPPAIAVYAIALSITAFVMAPVIQSIGNNLGVIDGKLPAEKITVERIVQASEPLRTFMLKNTSAEQRDRFLVIAKKHNKQISNLRDSDYVVLIPAFVISELQLAFEIGFVLYVPMIVIDLLVSNILLALGMQMVSPMVISMPLKILLFVVLDGWFRLFEGLALSYMW
ncbi:EscR/YscR/HrcR family type III secretion system export apparatus protein [Limnohabitans sp. 2KL-17]|uniref:type III secretion system export apparatus subunit SctR n=1 Tax=Limnohabitans sp. 2KL-17 TaxID=1100704 RepID=UPI000D339387|nr:type III secretion system export apparatus subunit SctR [Limnohabitans sp. 2KL-17]PUE48519.1 EscR/YscR/HrcR family type III secretion system export apparatus protein [Limnohabitans sp. 2KL-17]